VSLPSIPAVRDDPQRCHEGEEDVGHPGPHERVTERFEPRLAYVARLPFLANEGPSSAKRCIRAESAVHRYPGLAATAAYGGSLASESTIGGVAEWFKAAVLKTAVLARVPGVRIPSPPPAKSSTWLGEPEDPDGGAAGGVCTSICTSSVEASTLEQAIARITAELATAEDDVIPALVAERRALREELRNLSESRREPM
jgi:hypothetical protein